MQSLFAPTNSSKNVAGSPDATSMTGCALSGNYKPRAGNSNLDARTERDRWVRHLYVFGARERNRS
jgi:hypothetical protein